MIEKAIVHSRITGLGSAVPEQKLTNADLEQIVDTSDEWITARTGIKERRIARFDDSLTDYCTKAAQRAMEDAHVEPSEIDAILVGTISGDYRFPSTAIFIQSKLRAMNAFALDISATCSGWLYALFHADAMITAGKIRKALVLGAENLTRITDWEDRNTCVLFGDAAGAAVLEASNGEQGILSVDIGSNGDLAHLLYGRSENAGSPLIEESFHSRGNFLRMSGNEVFKHAVRTMLRASLKALKLADMKIDDIDWLFPHQANIRIVEAVAKRLRIPREQVFMNIHKYGNTSAASIPLALDDARREGKLKSGQTVLAVAFGGGFTWGSAVIRF